MGDHFYTIDAAERDSAIRGGYQFERIECYVLPPLVVPPPPGQVALLRFFNQDTGNHFYTTSATEGQGAVSGGGYRQEPTACYVFPAPTVGAVALFRLYNGREGGNDHFLTASNCRVPFGRINCIEMVAHCFLPRKS